MDNNVVPVSVGVTKFYDLTSGIGGTGVMTFPMGGGLLVGSDGMDIPGGKHAFAIVDQITIGELNSGVYVPAIGDGTYINFGTIGYGLQNLEIFVFPGVPEAFGIYDTNATQLFEVKGDGTAIVNRLAVNGLATPSVTSVGAAAGVGATATVVANGTDSAFQLNLKAGASGIATGTYCHVTFAKPFSKVPVIAFSTQGFPTNMAQSNNAYPDNVTAAGFDWIVGASGFTPGPNATQIINFIAIG